MAGADMAHDIFICHSSEDRAVAQALVAGLEKRGITCWVAPRDVMPGADYAQAIVGGISGAKALGLYTIWVDWRGDGLPESSPVRPDRIIRSISELR